LCSCEGGEEDRVPRVAHRVIALIQIHGHEVAINGRYNRRLDVPTHPSASSPFDCFLICHRHFKFLGSPIFIQTDWKIARANRNHKKRRENSSKETKIVLLAYVSQPTKTRWNTTWRKKKGGKMNWKVCLPPLPLTPNARHPMQTKKSPLTIPPPRPPHPKSRDSSFMTSPRLRIATTPPTQNRRWTG